MKFLKHLFGAKPFAAESEGLYVRAVEQARLPVFYEMWGIPDTVEGRFDMVTLHVYFILHRLKGQGEQADTLGQNLFDVMFTDMDKNLRHMGVSDMRIGQKIKELAQRFYGRVTVYDKGLDGEDGLLEDALHRNAFQGTDGDVAALAGYVRREIASIQALPVADLLSGNVSFGNPTPSEK